MNAWTNGWMLLALAGLFGDSAFERGMEAFRRRDFAAAEQAFQQAVAEHPHSASAHKFLGMVYSAQEKHRLAEAPFRRACELDPREENACYYLGRLYYTLSRFAESQKAFETALRDNRGRGRALHGLALTLEALGSLTEAERRFEEAIRAGERTARVDYGLFLFKQGRGEESLAALRGAGDKDALERVRKALESAPAARRQAAAAPLSFEPAPLAMVVNNDAAGNKHLVETMIAGVGVFDYDDDGRPDIYVANGAGLPSLVKSDPRFHNRLFRNAGGGAFSDVTAQAGVAGEGYSMGVAAADYDNDGHVDLFVTGVRSNTLFRNRGDGAFENVTAAAGLAGDGGWAVAAAWLDYDNDGLLDLFVVRYVVWDPASERHCGGDRPGLRGYCHPKHYRPLPNSLYRNLGGGTFRDVSEESGIAAHLGKGMGVAVGDYNHDGRLDVFVGNDTVANFLFRNEGGGKFSEIGLAAGVAYNGDGRALSSMGVSFGDYDNDGHEDVFITALTNETFPLFRNLGNGLFVDLSIPSLIAAASLPWSGWGNGMQDFNNDGYKDIFSANGNVLDNAEMTSSRQSRHSSLVFANRGDGTFRAEVLPGSALHRGAAFGDFDLDGRVDAVVTRLNEAPVILKNVSADTGHWLALRLVGTRSNRDGIGAWIRLVSDSGEQWNRVTTSVGYAGSSDRLAHFGLARDPQANLIEIRWPSGTVQRLLDVKADHFLTVTEPR